MAKGKPVTATHSVFGKKTFSWKSWNYLPGSVKKQWKVASSAAATPPEAKVSEAKASEAKAKAKAKAKSTKTSTK
jgi:hypothetical protein